MLVAQYPDRSGGKHEQCAGGRLELQPARGQDAQHVAVGEREHGALGRQRGKDGVGAAADVGRGRKVHSGVRALIVPGSARVKAQAEEEGLDRQFVEAGFEWRSAGCSMCLGMNGDILTPGQRSASTSNRNFEGRQGPGGRTHLVSPAVAAATAVAGHFSTPGDLA